MKTIKNNLNIFQKCILEQKNCLKVLLMKVFEILYGRKLINQIFFNKSGKALKSAPSSKAPKKSTQH